MKKDLLKEVSSGIFRITERGVLGMLKPPVNIYVITGKNGLVYDAGYGDGSSIRKFLKAYKEINSICHERGVDNHIDRILLSHAHADHFSGLRKLRKKLGFRVIISQEMKNIIKSSRVYRESYTPTDEKNKRIMPWRISYFIKQISRKFEFIVYALYWGVSFMDDPDILIDSETTIEINGEEWEIFSSPGHSGEHITLYSKDKGVLFSGDNVMNSINVWLGPPKSDLEQYENSLKQMLKLESIKIILPAHGSPIVKPYERLREIIEWRKKRTDDILLILKNAFPAGIPIKDILEKLYPSGSRMKKEFAGGWVELTLLKLVKEKKIIREKEYYIYKPVKNPVNAD
jgi:glyoxylase-like metal-dependent hydrolase (beta-lactamase superfamily II)